jgi:hypothetical protein
MNTTKETFLPFFFKKIQWGGFFLLPTEQDLGIHPLS